MSIELDPKEVLEHLYCLGYTSITKEQLKDFIKDLKKLIKYDQQKREKHYRSSQENYKTSNKENIIDCIPCVSCTTKISEDNNKKSKHTKEEENYKCCNCGNNISINSCSRGIPFCGNTNINDTPLQPTSCSCTCTCDVNQKQCYLKEVWEEPKNADQDSETCDQNFKQQDKLKDNSANKKQINLKPCPSFIRPSTASTKPKLPKGDPVALYQYYKSLWSQQTLPGENSHEDLRWRIRHKMMAAPVKTKGQAGEEKSSKKPEWVTS